MLCKSVQWVSVVLLLLLNGCVILPTGPSVMALPGTGRSFSQFRADDAMCRQYAMEQVGGVPPSQAVVKGEVLSAVAGTAVGAAAGAAMGGEKGAAVGAGAGLLVGSLAGTDAGRLSAYDIQQRYDSYYVQCMYANGHLVPMSGQMLMERTQPWDSASPAPLMTPPPPPASVIPSPPPGPPPAPPPGVR